MTFFICPVGYVRVEVVSHVVQQESKTNHLANQISGIAFAAIAFSYVVGHQPECPTNTETWILCIPAL